MKLASHSKIYGPVFIGSPNKNPWEPEIGNIVTLKSGEVSMTAKILTSNERLYTGEIIDFENYDEDEYEGKKSKDFIQFDYINIVSCKR